MTKDDIIRMAREGKSVVEQVHAYVSANNTDFTSESMAAMVKDFMAAEREACATVCDEMSSRDKLSNYYKVAANAIRARGNT